MSSQIISSEKQNMASRIANMSGANNLFGTIGAASNSIISRMDFIPSDGDSNTISLNGKGDDVNPVWIGLKTKAMQMWAYIYCSPLAGIIDRLAEADTNGRIGFVDEENGSPLKNINRSPKLSRIKNLLKKPNPWQTWKEFDAEQVVLCKIFGYCPVLAVRPKFSDTSYTKALVNINPVLVEPVKNDSYSPYKSNQRIKFWKLSIIGDAYEIPSEDIILIKDGYISNPNDEFNLPMSKLFGMDFLVSNFCAAMEADNVLLKKKGPLGVFSYDPGKDMAGATPFDPQAKDELQKDLLRYGLTIGQLQYVISKLPIKWQSMSFNLRDLMTKETIRSAIDSMCDRLGYPAELMSGKNATYENRHTSERFLYQNNVIPFSDRRMDVYTEFFELKETKISKNFNHLAVLQEDIVKAGEAERAMSDALEKDWLNGIITYNEYRVSKQRNPIPGMDIFYIEYIEKYPSMNPNKKQDAKASPENTGTQE